MIFGLVLVILTWVAAGYSLKSACAEGRVSKDARPMFMAFFLLTSLSVLELTWILSPEITLLSEYFVTVWFGVESLLVVCVLWLIATLNATKKAIKNRGKK